MEFRMPALHLSGLSKAFHGTRVLNNLSLQLELGEILGIVGSNGAGKSTLIRLLGGWLAPDAGDISILGHNVTNWTSARRYGLGLREVSQFPLRDSDVTGNELIAIAQAITKPLNWDWLLRASVPPTVLEKITPEIRRCLEVNVPIRELSSGTRKMVALVAALATSPHILLLDEPTAGLDEAQRRMLSDTLLTLTECAVIVVEHDTYFVNETCGRMAELREGVLCQMIR
jgi:ABC-type multidrug transport system ATPase subunit